MPSFSQTAVISDFKPRTRSLIQLCLNMGVAVGGGVLARLLGTVTQILVARRLGVADFGVYTSVYTLLGVVIMLTSLGLDIWLLRAASDIGNLDMNISRIFSLRLILTSVMMAIGVLLLVWRGTTGVTLPIAMAGGLGLLFELLHTTAYTALRARLRNIAAALLQVGVAGLTLFLIWRFWSSRSSVLVITNYRLLADSVGVVVVVWLLHRSLHFVWRPSTLWLMIRQARMFFAADFLANVALKFDLTMVSVVLGPIFAGTYGPALTIINTTFLVPNIMWQVILPVITRWQWNSANYRRAVGLTTLACLAYGLLWAVILGWASPQVMHLVYGAQYANAVPLLQIMALIPVFKSLNFCSATLMVALDAQALRTKLLAVGAATNLLLNLVCIPRFGLLGAAWVNLGTEFVLLICYGYGAWLTVRRLQ